MRRRRLRWRREELHSTLQQIAAREEGTTGIAITHLESGRHVEVNGDVAFPMHSVCKVPIAIAVLRGVEEGALRLDATVKVRPEDVAPVMVGPKDRWSNVPKDMSTRALLELSLMDSDNTATDKLLSLVGGPDRVTRQLRTVAITGIKISRSLKQGASEFCVGPQSQNQDATRIVESCRQLSRDQQVAARQREERRELDSATPNALVNLLDRLYKGALLKGPSRDLVLQMMYGSRVGSGRIKAQLPSGTRVAHKSGSGYLATNDVGVIDLPNGRGHLVVAVFIKLSTRDGPQQDRTIAELARCAYDFFTR